MAKRTTTKQIMRATRTHKATRTDNPTASTAGRRSKPKTAYELLERVCEHILEEPRRYNQKYWAVVGKRAIALQRLEAPPCGTVCCRAGWVVSLTDGPQRTKTLDLYDRVAIRADQILDLTRDSTRGLYDYNAVDGKPGTMAYVKRGVAGLREFMKLHKAHLQSRLLKDVPK